MIDDLKPTFEAKREAYFQTILRRLMDDPRSVYDPAERSLFRVSGTGAKLSIYHRGLTLHLVLDRDSRQVFFYSYRALRVENPLIQRFLDRALEKARQSDFLSIIKEFGYEDPVKDMIATPLSEDHNPLATDSSVA